MATVNKKIKRSQEGVIVLIDGSNLYHRLKEKEINIRNQLSFDYTGLAKYLSRGRKIIRKTYYVGLVRAKMKDRKGRKLMANQHRLFSHLRKQDWKIYFGYLLKTDKKYHEKGVDVKIAVDLLVGAYEDKYETAILVSSDTDLLPAIIKVRQLGKGVEYIGFGHKPSFAMQKHASLSRLLIRDELLPFTTEKEK